MIVSTSPHDLVVRLTLLGNGALVVKLLHEKGAAIYRRSFSDPSTFKLSTLLQWLGELSPSFSDSLPAIACHHGVSTFPIKEDGDLSKALALASCYQEVLLSVRASNCTEAPKPSNSARRRRSKFFPRSRTQGPHAERPLSRHHTDVSTQHVTENTAKTAPSPEEATTEELAKGDEVQYYRKFKQGKPFHKTVKAQVVKVHMDELPYYYTIRIDDGDGDVSEIQTERSRLTKVTARKEGTAKPAPATTAVPTYTSDPNFFSATAYPYGHRRKSRGFARSQTAAPRFRAPPLWAAQPLVF